MILIEEDNQEETRLINLMSAVMPEDVRLVIYWVKNTEQAMVRLLDDAYGIQRVIARHVPATRKLETAIVAFDMDPEMVIHLHPDDEQSMLQQLAQAARHRLAA